MTDAALVLLKLSRLADAIARARARRPESPQVLAEDDVLRDALALVFLVAAQEAIDVAYHVCADEGWGVPDSSAAAFELLASRGVIGADLAGRLGSLARVRNRIVQGYAGVDHERFWSELPAGLDDLEALSGAVARRLPEP